MSQPTLQEQARALGDPTRHEVFRYVADADHPVDVAELTEHFGLNHNAIRQHLSKLVETDLLVEAKARPSGRGRPRLRYVLNPAADSRWGVTGPYERLSLLLTEVVRSGDTPVEVGRRAGRQRAAGGPGAADDPLDELVHEMARQGFAPSLRTRSDEFDITLHSCPFESSAAADPETVCGLHQGLARGIAESVDGLVIDELVVHDPHRAGCHLHGRVEADPPHGPAPVD